MIPFSLWCVGDFFRTCSRPTQWGYVYHVGMRDYSRGLSGLSVIDFGENAGGTSCPVSCVRLSRQTEVASFRLVRPDSIFFFFFNKSQVSGHSSPWSGTFVSAIDTAQLKDVVECPNLELI